MSELISGKEAKLAWANGENVEYMPLSKWNTLGGSTPLSIFERDDVKFRLKPRTIMIGDMEVPAPFEPKEGERFYYFSDEYTTGYASAESAGFYGDMSLGVWRTEDEVKQVVVALKKLFKGE